MHDDVTRATLVVARGRCTRLRPWRRRNDRDGVQSTEDDGIKSDQRGRLMLALGDEQLSKKVDVRMASSARKVTLAAFDLLALKMPRLPSEKTRPRTKSIAFVLPTYHGRSPHPDLTVNT